MKITLKELKRIYDEKIDLCVRKASICSESYTLGEAGAYYDIMMYLIHYNLNYNELPKVKFLQNKKKDIKDKQLIYSGYIKLFDNKYDIYSDDYGQCFVLKLDDNFIGLGTYNFDLPEAVLFEVMHNIHSKNLKKLKSLYDLEAAKSETEWHSTEDIEGSK